ncbi:hypothetical protein HMPREF1410_00299 [Helicobacter pylori GAM249T]|nr:hypothetical protein HMPREF1393_00359 [Helicobacter pylori GAM103Bi]EMH11527.1 hypothetical protein HMPREF1410_00299 [Helicobacter pylori GAM249T]
MNFNILYFRFFFKRLSLDFKKMPLKYFSFDCEKSSIIPTIKWC